MCPWVTSRVEMHAGGLGSLGPVSWFVEYAWGSGESMAREMR
jgi:hypothetical protein